jgi:hypothetical protein
VAWEVEAPLVFRLDVVRFRNLYKGYSDILQPSGRLRPLQNFFVVRTVIGSISRGVMGDRLILGDRECGRPRRELPTFVLG